MPRVIVIGAGFSGLTTAAAFALAGHRVEIVADRRADRPAQADPEVASFYPAASVIPVSVGLGRVEETTVTSLALFGYLARQWPEAVRLQRHFEIAEALEEVPESFRLAAQQVREIPPGEMPALRRSGAARVRGWEGKITFVEAPRYLRRLVRLVESLGVDIVQGRVEDLDQVPSADLVVVCAGLGSPALLGDARPQRLLRGHLIHVDPLPVDWPDGARTSFHYLPTAETFAQPDGSPGELYFYPRSDVWILGGTRQPMRRSPVGALEVEGEVGPTRMIGGTEIPAVVYDLHRELLASWLGVDIDRAGPRVVVGLRYARDPGGAGVRVDVDASSGRPVVCNYGHGGAGVTLSWGCAIRALALAETHLGRPASPRPGLGELVATQTDRWRDFR
jgi:glycine/D-amino acid oxidase-like deaminating enzyme